VTATRAPSRVLVLLATVAFALFLLANAVSAGANGATTVAHRVQAGETLWSIALIYSDPSDDPRRLVDEIAAINGVRVGGILPGQVLEVPAS